MKTTVKLALLVIFSILTSLGFAQSRYGNGQPTDMDVNGVFIGGTYTKAQVTAKWGTPTKYRSSMSEFGLNEVYDYSSNQFLFGDNGIFHSFSIDTPNFVVYKSKSGGFKVGDNVSRINAIGLGAPMLKPDGTGVIQSGDDWFTFGYTTSGKNNIITWISFVSSI